MAATGRHFFYDFRFTPKTDAFEDIVESKSFVKKLTTKCLGYKPFQIDLEVFALMDKEEVIGYTVICATSIGHVSLHSKPLSGSASLDIFLADTDKEVDSKVRKLIKETFKCRSIVTSEILRDAGDQ